MKNNGSPLSFNAMDLEYWREYFGRYDPILSKQYLPDQHKFDVLYEKLRIQNNEFVKKLMQDRRNFHKILAQK